MGPTCKTSRVALVDYQYFRSSSIEVRGGIENDGFIIIVPSVPKQYDSKFFLKEFLPKSARQAMVVAEEKKEADFDIICSDSHSASSVGPVR